MLLTVVLFPTELSRYRYPPMMFSWTLSKTTSIQVLYTATTVRVKPERNDKFCYHILSFLVFVFKSNKSIIIYYDYLEAFRFYSDTLRDI